MLLPQGLAHSPVGPLTPYRICSAEKGWCCKERAYSSRHPSFSRVSHPNCRDSFFPSHPHLCNSVRQFFTEVENVFIFPKLYYIGGKGTSHHLFGTGLPHLACGWSPSIQTPPYSHSQLDLQGCCLGALLCIVPLVSEPFSVLRISMDGWPWGPRQRRPPHKVVQTSHPRPPTQDIAAPSTLILWPPGWASVETEMWFPQVSLAAQLSTASQVDKGTWKGKRLP